MRKLSTKLIIIAILVATTGLGFFILEESEIELSINGVLCNRSSIRVWLAMSEGERTSTYALAPGQCTNFFTQDVEAIWGRDCSTGPCSYQAWKLKAGHFEVKHDPDSSSGSVLRIQGWGIGSRWQITEDWPKPDLSSMRYSLVK
jgi:hypothetical protein